MTLPSLIASDVDGTLLDDQERLTPRTRDAIYAARDAGAHFVLATGRPPRWIAPVVDALGFAPMAVCANGAVIYDVGRGKVVSVHGLEPVQLHDLADAMDQALPGARLATERVLAGGQEDGPPAYVCESEFRNPWGDGDAMFVSRAEVLGRPAIKLLVSDPRMTSGEMAEAAKELIGEQFAVTYSSNSGLIEITAKDVTKATGLAEVAERLDVSQDKVIAFGDMPNDVEMLAWAGTGVAMANAHPAVLEVADEVTASNAEDGVAQVLERWF